MKAYKADGSFRDENPVIVTEGGGGDYRRLLTVRTQHGAAGPQSPDGHAWGYGGSGPAQLALDILWDVYGSEPAPRLLLAFRTDVIARLDQAKGFLITEDSVREWVNRHGFRQTVDLPEGAGSDA